MNLNRQRLVDVLEILKTSYGNRVMDVSYCVKFAVDVKNHAVYLNTTDFHTFQLVDFGDVSLTVLTDVPEEFLIQFKQFYSIVKASTTDDVLISGKSSENYVTVETNGRYRFNLYGDSTLFPVADFTNDVISEWDAGELRDTIDKVRIAVSKDVTKIAYQGINYDGNWAACDNRRFSIVQGDNDVDIKPMLIPISLCDVISNCKGMVTIGVNKDQNMVILQNPDSGLVGGIRLIEATFVPYQRMLENKKPYVRMMMPKQHLLGLLNRLSSFTDKLFKVANFSIMYQGGDDASRGMHLKVTIENKDGGEEIIEAIDYDYDGSLPDEGEQELASFSYQIDNLVAGISAIESDQEVSLSFQEDGKLWVDEDNFHYLLSRISG